MRHLYNETQQKSLAILIYDSLQDAPWHMERTTYCCFLSNLTGFMGFHCTGPGGCHKSTLQSYVNYHTSFARFCKILFVNFIGNPF